MPHGGFNSPHSSCKKCIEAITSYIEAVTTHIEDVTSHIEDVTFQIAPLNHAWRLWLSIMRM